MRRLWVALAALALVTAFPSPLATPGIALAAPATCDTFSETAPANYWCTVPEGVSTLYYVVAGGDGGWAFDTLNETEMDGGHGAKITGSFAVTAGQLLDIVVAGNGPDGFDTAGGGGGYSSIATDTVPLVVAGGGGGAGWNGSQGGSGTGGDASAGGGYGGDAANGMTGSIGASGGRTGVGGDGGTSVLGMEGEDPIVGYAGSGGTYGVALGDGGNAATGSKGGGGGGAFAGLGGLADGTSTTPGGTPGAGGWGGLDGGGGGGGYGGGGGGGGGTGSGGGGGGGSSLVPDGATLELSLGGHMVSLSTTPPPDTTAPSIWLQQAAGQADPTKVSLINFELTANEVLDTTTVTAEDFTVSTGNGTIGTVSCSGTPTACTIPVTATERGVVTIAPSATFAVADPSGNVQVNAGYWDLSVTYLVPAANDDFADAQVLTGSSGSVTGTTTDATEEGSEQFWFTYTNSVWFSWTNSGRKDVEATFSLLDCSLSLRALDSSAGPPDWYPTNWVAWSPGGPDCVRSTMSFVARAGVTYTIQVAVPGSGTSGDFTLSWSTQAWRATSGSVTVTLTNTRGDATSCTVVAKTVNLLADRELRVFAGLPGDEWEDSLQWQTVGGRWTYDPVLVPRSIWSAGSGYDVWIGPYDILTSDGITAATLKVVNRCQS